MLKQQNIKLRSRIAPTPSGFLHIGNAYSFLLTSHLAQENKGALLLRIDDMDSERVRPEYIQDIFETLHFLGIQYQEGPKNASDFTQNYSQHLRLSIYQNLLKKICDTGLVYACNCSRKTLFTNKNICNCQHKKIPLDTANAAWRIQIPSDTIIQFHDEYLGNQEIDLSSEMPDFIIRKKDGMPAYQISSLADDLYYNINYIVRGEDLLHSTAAQLYLAKLVGAESFISTRFYHHLLLKNTSGEKLSKSADVISIKALRANGTDINKMVENLLNQNQQNHIFK